MKSQDNSAKHIGNNVEPKEGERVLLSCNTADVRSPSLDFTNSFESKDAELDYLAQILVQAYLDYKSNEYRYSKAGRDLLPGFDKGTS